ncbi:putative flavin-containing monooxygenase 1-like protein [Corchorus olitorius]|uniref:Flavin-containing monooxygenase n=1 Tax=Corchorus olitorius TaxID=93759 RepID=A0A1R3IV74_9ROSI|nr:putative flavin-containing monooxygenase 1-like protein [Corchorus olitorius]
MASEQGYLKLSKIGIIGAGISGIAAAKQLSNHNPIVFEATDSIGGVWKHCSFASTKLQTPRCDFEFSDYPWPQRDNSNFPTYLEILDYLHGYATHFDVLKYIKFNSRVVEIRYIGDKSEEFGPKIDHVVSPGEFGPLLKGHPVWEVTVETHPSKTLEKYGFELLVVCIGKYGDIPRMPIFPPNKGQEVFGGKVMHTLEYSKLDKEAARELLKGKKVAVVGYKKSAIDLATECAEANQVPAYWIWGLPFFLFYSTRSSQFLHQTPNQGLLGNLLCPLLSPLRKAVSKFIESYLVWKLPLVKYGLKPDHPFEEDYASCQMAILPENFFSEADKGKIQFKRASKWWFWNGGIEFDDNTKLEADVVLLASGYEGKKKIQNLLPEPFSSLVVDSSAELRCKWLSRLADDYFRLPSIEKMLEQNSKELEIMKKTTRFYKRHCISTFSINHSDEICEEMGWKSWRKNNWLLEAFAPYNSQDYGQDN